MTLADFAQATHSVPRPAAASLDVARLHSFTGEITFLLDPLVRVYLDAGVPYMAEVDGSPPVSQQLLDAAVITAEQIERGMVRVGDLEHLGRLFERDDSVDRDAVLVVVEHHTAQLVGVLADSVVSAIDISPYRHHPSGLHRWFVAPAERSAGGGRPIGEVAQVDRSVVEEIPGLGRSNQDMTIEWVEADPSGLGVPADSLVDAVQPTDAELQAELDRFDADEADWTTAFDGDFLEESGGPLESPIGEFHIVWPDGTEDENLVGDGVAIEPHTDAVVDGPAPAVFDNDVRPVLDDIPPLDTPENPLMVDPSPDPVAPVLDEPVVTFDGPLLSDSGLSDVEGDDDYDDEHAVRPLLQRLADANDDTVEDDTIGVDTVDVDTVDVDTVETMDDESAANLARPLLPSNDPGEPIPDLASVADPVDDTSVESPRIVVPPSTPVAEAAVVDALPEPDAVIPDEVAAAVKRALQAIDEASVAPIVIQPGQASGVTLPRLLVDGPAVASTADVADTADVVPTAEVAETPPPPPPPTAPEPASANFAPPTVDMRAEAVYKRAASEARTAEPVAADPESQHIASPDSGPVGAVSDDGAGSGPSVVFVEDESAAPVARRSALRRLISGLRNNE